MLTMDRTWKYKLKCDLCDTIEEACISVESINMDAFNQMIKKDGWILAGGEHICPTCVTRLVENAIKKIIRR